jgi:hypothetical protein
MVCMYLGGARNSIELAVAYLTACWGSNLRQTMPALCKIITYSVFNTISQHIRRHST